MTFCFLSLGSIGCSSPLTVNNGEECPRSRPLSFIGASWAYDHFLHDLVAFTTRIVSKFLLGFLAVLGFANDHVGPGAVRILPASLLKDDMLRRSTGWNNGQAQLTSEHARANECPLGVAHFPRGFVRPFSGRNEKWLNESK